MQFLFCLRASSRQSQRRPRLAVRSRFLCDYRRLFSTFNTCILRFINCIQISLNLEVYLDFLAGRGISDSTCNCQLFVLDQQQTGFILILAVVSLALCFEFLEPQADPLENLMGMNGGLNFDVK